MAASTANMVQSASGKMYEASSPQGMMISTKGGTRRADNAEESGGIFSRILATLQNQTSLLTEIDDNTESSESVKEKRERRVSSENTDKKSMFSGMVGGIGSGLKSVGGTLSNMNPFKDGLGTKMSILLLSGALYALTKLGPQITDKLASFLEWLKTDAWTDIVAGWEKIKDGFAASWLKVKVFLNWMKGIFKSVSDYVDAFDIDGDGELDPEERKALFEDARKKITNGIVKYIKGIALGILGIMFGPALISGAIKIGSAAIAKAIGGSTVAAAAAGGGPPSVLAKSAKVLGIAGIVAAGILGVYNASTNAFANAAKDEKGKIKKESFAGFFLAGGDGKGGFKNAIENAFTGGPTAVGALAGVALGAVGGPFGMIAGGLMGAAIGGLIGAVTGYVGADKMTEVITGVTSAIGAAVDEVATFFGGVVAGIESFIAGDSYEAGKDAYIAKNADPKEVREQKLKVLEAAVEKEQIAYDNRDTSLPQRGKETKLNIAKSKLRTFKIKNDLIEKTIKKVEKVDLTKAYDSAGELPGLYTALEGMDPGEFSMNRFGNEYERTLKKIKDIESSIPAYMLNDVQQQFESTPTTSAKVIKKLTSTVNAPVAERAEVVVMPSVIDKSEIKTFNSNYSSSLGSNNDYSTVRVLNLDGAF